MPSQQPEPVPSSKYLEENNELSEECRELIPSLPRGNGWVASYLYQYQGFWYKAWQLQGVLACQQHFKAQDTDILLVTTPKSGTTWLKAIMFSLLNRNRYPKTKINHPLLTNNPHVLVPFLEFKLYADDNAPELTTFTSPRLFSTHLPCVSLPKSVKNSECKIVYLCRNPKDTFVSLWHFTNNLRPHHLGTNSFEEVFDMFCRGVSISGPFWDHVLGYWEESLKRPRNVLFLKYEELKEQPTFCLRRLAEFIGCPFSLEEVTHGAMEEILGLCSFESLSNLEVNKTGKLSSGEENRAFFRRGEIGDWKNYLTAEMVDRLDSISTEVFHGTGLIL